MIDSRVFRIPTEVKQLSSVNKGAQHLRYQQVSSASNKDGTNFPGGEMRFDFNCSGNEYWIPNKSYMRLRCSLTDGGSTQLTKAANIAPNMFLAGGLFQSGEFRIQNRPISKVTSHMAQIDALKTRQRKSKPWLDSIGSVTILGDADFDNRQKAVVSNSNRDDTTKQGRAELGFAAGATLAHTDGTDVLTFSAVPSTDWVSVGDTVAWATVATAPELYDGDVKSVSADGKTITLTAGVTDGGFTAAAVAFSRIRRGEAGRQVTNFEIIWQPPLSVFDLDHGMPAGQYSLVLNPETTSQYQLNAIESLLASKVADTDFKFRVEQSYFYVAKVDGMRVDNLTYYLDLEQINLQTTELTGTNGSLKEKAFDVSPSTHSLTVALQDSTANADTRYSASKFKLAAADSELLINRMFLQYASVSKPSPDADPSFVAGTDYMVQRYAESVQQIGAWKDKSPVESYDEWKKRGAYYHFDWPRDGSDTSTRVNVHIQTSGALTNANLLLFDHSKQYAAVSIQNGHVTEVSLQNR